MMACFLVIVTIRLHVGLSPLLSNYLGLPSDRLRARGSLCVSNPGHPTKLLLLTVFGSVCKQFFVSVLGSIHPCEYWPLRTHVLQLTV